MKIVSVAEMRSLELCGMARGISGDCMMGLAGLNAAKFLLEWLDEWPAIHHRRFTILAGKGNNGGDAWVVARALWEMRRADITIYSVYRCEDLKGDAALHAMRLPREVVLVEGCESLPEEALRPGTVVVDGLLGTGTKGELREPCKTIIKQVNASGLPVLALDVPSGLDADTGAGPDAMVADVTVTMCFPKTGLFLQDGPRTCGRLEIADIGLTKDLMEKAVSSGELFTHREAMKLVARRRNDGYKGTFGHVLCLGGSGQYCGAPVLSALGAVRAGAGLVTLAVPDDCLAKPPLHSLIFRKLGKGQSAFSAGMTPELKELLPGKTALVYGPGTGSDAEAEFLEVLLGSELPMVVDADGLRLLAAHPGLLPRKAGAVVLTPHPGEMQALQTGFGIEATGGRLEQAKALARRTQAVVVLKGRFTVVAAPDGNATLNASGGPALATAGSGDVLAGIIGALLAQGLKAEDAARLGVFLHGLAGDLWKGAKRSLSADELPELVSNALVSLSLLT